MCTLLLNCIAHLASKTQSVAKIRLAVATAAVLFATVSVSHAAYSFLTVSGNNVPGNGASSQFSGANGTISVSHQFSAGGNGPQDNINSAIIPSDFSTLPVFAGVGPVQGHLAQTQYGANSKVTFTLFPSYTITPDTAFGMWNTTDEVAQPPYRIEFVDTSNNVITNVSFLTQIGTGDNTGSAGVNGRHQMVLNPLTGDISAGATINGGIGIHTNALFWKGIPANTKMINVYGNLGPLAGNNVGDGVGYYFAERVVPEPCSAALGVLALVSLGMLRGRRRK